MANKPTLNETDIKLLGRIFSTKEELNKRFETFLEAVKGIIKVTIQEEAVTKDELREQIKHLPTKEEFYKSQDELMAEVKKIREEQPVQAHQISRNADDIRKIKKHLNLPAFD